jgi:hypothetical protein
MTAAMFTTAAAAQTVLHVSPSGRDANPGTLAAPLQTLAGARDRVRALKAQGPVVVEFAAGIYPFTEAVSFGEADSGTAGAPITYRAAQGGEVRFTGGREVAHWRPVKDASIRQRLPEEARSHVLVADLQAQGITDLGKLAKRGFNMGTPVAEAELFADDKPMTLARWPNEGFRGIKKRPSITEVVLDTDRVARWTEESDPWIFAYWHHDWAEIYEPIRGFDASQNMIKRDPKIKPQYGITPGRARWYVLNLLSELDQPGEYYVDRTGGKLYFWPPKAGEKTVLSISDGLISGEDLAHVTFQGFVLEACRATAMVFRNSTETKVVGCTIRNTGHRAVIFSGGSKDEVYGCDVYETGEGGISMSGGDRKTLTPAHHNAENNLVHDYSRRARTYKTGITISGVGNRMAHNLVHHGPHMAISAGGNDHIVEFNEIHNAVYESGDAGAYYVGRDWTQRGNILRYNYWHEIVGATGHGGMTIYLDDQHSGHTIYGNVFEHCSRAVFIGGGDDNVVDNNVFLNCWKAAHMDNRGMGWQKKATDDPKGTLRTRARAMPIKSELWAKRYPNLVNVFDDDPGVPKRNIFRRNVSAGGSWDDIHQGTRKYQTVEDNLVFDQDPSWIRLVKDAGGKPVEIVYKDPAALRKIGFEPIPVAKIGLYADPRRASWPVENPVDIISLPDPPKPKAMANLKPNPTLRVPRSATPSGEAMLLTCDYDGSLVKPAAEVRFGHDGKTLRVTMSTPLPKKRNLGAKWGQSDAIELSLKAADGANSDTLVLRGFTNGKTMIFRLANGNQEDADALAKAATYEAKVVGDTWTCSWAIPLAQLGVTPGDRMRANVTVRRSGTGNWVMWRPTHGDSTSCERVGTLELAQ